MGVDAVAKYAVELVNKVSGPADDASAALAKLQRQIATSTKELAAMQKALKNLQLAAKPNEKAIDSLKAKIDRQKESLSKAQAKFLELGGAVGKPATKLAQFSKAMGDMPGPLGGLLSRLAKVQEIVGGGVIRAGLLGMTAALGALAIASAIATKRLYEYGLAQADVRREERARLGGMKETQDALDRVAARVPASRSSLETYAASLQKAGLEGAEFESALEAVGLSLAVGKKGSADAFVTMAKNTKAAGKSVTALSDQVKSELGADGADAMTSLAVQAAKAGEAFDSLFGAVEIDTYAAKWKEVNDLLTQNTASGQALKQIIADILQPLIDTSTAAAPIVKRFFQGMLLGVLDLQIAFLQLQIWWFETFGAPDAKEAVDESRRWVVDLGRVISKILVPTLAIAGLAVLLLTLRLTVALIPALARSGFAMLRFGLMAIPRTLYYVMYLTGRMLSLSLSFLRFIPVAWGAVAPFLPFIAAILGVAAAVAMLVFLWDELKTAFSQVEWLQVGADIIHGIILGLTGQWPELAKSMLQIATDAWKVFKGAIGASSPSKLFTAAGLTIPQGVAQGIETGSPEVQQAAERMVEVPTAIADVPSIGAPGVPGAAGAAGSAVAAAAGGSVKVEIGQVVVNASSDDPRTMASDFVRELESALEGLALQLGARVPGGAPA